MKILSYLGLLVMLISVAAAQTVHLAWQPPSATPPSCGAITQAQVYRADVSGGEAIGINKIASVLLPAASYDDKTVAFGKTYWYKISWWSLPCNKESPFSNEVSAAIPAQIIIIPAPVLAPAQVVIP